MNGDRHSGLERKQPVIELDIRHIVEQLGLTIDLQSYLKSDRQTTDSQIPESERNPPRPLE